MKHKELVDIGAKWLTTIAPNFDLKCQYAVKEFVFAGLESPDIFGIRSGNTVLIEVKVSRSDFLADKKKPHRAHDFDGLGQFRYYLCPSGLIRPDELTKWGLLEFSEGKITIAKKSDFFETQRNSEMNLMYSILRRITKPGVMEFEAKKTGSVTDFAVKFL